MKELIQHQASKFYAPTPVKWRKIGDAIQDGSIALGAAVALMASPPAWIPVAILIIGRIGKIITNFNT